MANAHRHSFTATQLTAPHRRHPQERYKSIPGIVSTAVGYTGGTTANPTYNTVCRNDGHTEAIKVDFDPSVISFEELMQTFFSEAGGGGGKKQYQSAVWPQTEEQTAVAQRVATEKQSTVPVLKPTEWFDAEEHHQDYIAKSRGDRERERVSLSVSQAPRGS